MYTIKVPISGQKNILFKCKFQTMWNYPQRQAIKIFGSDNGIAIDGMLTVTSFGDCTWSGTEGVSATLDFDSGGIITVELPQIAYDYFTLISCDLISSV